MLRPEPTTIWLGAIGVVGALVIGLAANALLLIAVVLVSLVPLASHTRRVGLRNTIAEPSAATIIVGFYFFVFPLRALVIAASGYGDVFLSRGSVPSRDVVWILILASVATTLLIETYYFALGERSRPTVIRRASLDGQGVVPFATFLAGVTLLSLAGVIIQYGGLAAAQAALLSHSTVSALQGNTSAAASGWAIFSVPAVWSSAYVAVNGGSAHRTRIVFGSAAAIIVFAALVIYGSRLSGLLDGMGIWIILYYAGHRIPARVIVGILVIGVLVSVPIVNGRTSGATSRLSTIERYSRISSYGQLDVALALYHQPQQVRGQLTKAQRWLDFPLYFVPSLVWHGRPNLNASRLGLYVARDLGGPADQATGFPATYILEGWLIGGWPVALILSVIVGAFLGWARRRLIDSRMYLSAADVLIYCFVVTLGWTYYKDGDILSTVIGQSRSAVYLGVLMLLTGVVGLRRVVDRGSDQEIVASREARGPDGRGQQARALTDESDVLMTS